MRSHDPFPTLFDPDDVEPRTAPTPQHLHVNHLAVVNGKFPRIAKSIRMLWGTPELQRYLSNLIIDDQHYINGNARQGFPPDVMSSLLVIYNKHTEGAPITDVWDGAM